MACLSRRSADASLLLSSLERDPVFTKQFFTGGVFNQAALANAVAYVVGHYSAGESEAEEAIQHLLRGARERRTAFLSNRVGQEHSITIPGTATHGPRTVPINTPPPPVQKPLSVPADPSVTPEQKTQDLTKPIVDKTETRQQRLINSLKALKVAIGEVAKDMFQTEMVDEGLDKVTTKCIEAISAQMADQTSNVVKQMASPILGSS